jgi:hypothetical protein
MPKTYQSQFVEYVYSEIQTQVSSDEPVLLLHLNEQEHKPLARRHLSIENARLLHKDLTSLLEQHDDCDDGTEDSNNS